MTDWVRDLEGERLIRIEPNPELEPKLESKPELKEMKQQRPLSDIFYCPMTSSSLCFNLSDLEHNLTFEL